MPSYMSPTFASRRRASGRLKQQSSASPTSPTGERSPLSPASAARVMKAQAAALERTPPRMPASGRLAVHNAISPQDLAAGARSSAKRGVQILRLEAEAAAKRAAARELEEVRGALSQLDTKPISPVASSHLVSSSETVHDGVAASTMATWASNMRSRLADKDDEVAQLRAELAEERAKPKRTSHTEQSQLATATEEILGLRAQLAAAEKKNVQLSAALSATTQKSEHMAKLDTEQVVSARPEWTTAAQMEMSNLRQRCETAEQMLWLTERKAQADEEASDSMHHCVGCDVGHSWSEWRTAALKRIELLQDAVDAWECSPQQQPVGDAQADSAEPRISGSNPGSYAISKNATRAVGTSPVHMEREWLGNDDEPSKFEDDEDDSEDIADNYGESWPPIASRKRTARGSRTMAEDVQQHANEELANGERGDYEELEDKDDEVDSGAILKLRDELAVLNAKVKGLEDELDDELQGSEDQAFAQETSEESDEKERHRSEPLQDESSMKASIGDESWMFDTLATSGRSRRQLHHQQPFDRGDYRRRGSDLHRKVPRRNGTGAASAAHEYSDPEADTERSLHEELAHGEAHGDLHSKLMLLVAILVLVLAMAVTPFELALALASDVVSAFGGILAAVSRGSRYLVGTLSETIRMLCGWAVLGTSNVVQAVADTLG